MNRIARRGSSSRHQLALRISSEITETLREMYWPEAETVKPMTVIRVLNQAGVSFVLVGNYGLTGWRGEERATQDVDVLVRKSHVRKAVRALHRAFPRLELEDFPVVTRFRDPTRKKVVIDVMKPADALYQAVFKNCIPVGDTHFVPTLEMAIACKYAAMISPNRVASKKYTDAGDFYSMVETNAQAIDRAKLKQLADLIYSGAGDEVLRMVEDVKAGRRLEI